ncbi:flagellar protein FlgN [Photobacterium frigidiphilum]|uniref:Flagellar protein FlgN n=1 Tax=Photobacterium frigidiphilum TaxID=264736 RepID=A0A2T3JE56_9GAMM|nr:flagellar export chaperone FlgN [Photobacterium frigidiphilum]PSU47191.1 flagellar protein FlgN [Photobacterium frigidiphilum]
MATQAELVKALITELAQDVKSYQQLAQQLKHQQLLLQNRDSKALLTHNVELQLLMQQLNNHAQYRGEHLIALGMTADDAGMKCLLAALPTQYSQQARQLWQQLYDVTLQCQEQNNANGRLLAQQKQMMDKLLKPQQQYSYSPNI